jgi:hypothetical protein|tara:strand:- start:111 stop:308 length:198 start_codon:yes stop_codon:yes gene_type:complete
MKKENLKETNCGNTEICCTICDAEIDVDNGDIVGYFGISEVSFCVWCLSSIREMVYHHFPDQDEE